MPGHSTCLGYPTGSLSTHSRPYPWKKLPASADRSPGQIIRSILFRLAEGRFVMVLMAGPGQVSWKHIRAALGVSRISMASEAEVLEATGFVRGAVTPLGLPRPLRILADEIRLHSMTRFPSVPVCVAWLSS